VFDVAGTISFN